MEDTLAAAFADGRLSRRQFVLRLLRAGLSVPAAGAVLAACTRDKAGPKPGPKHLSGRIQVLAGFGPSRDLAVQQALTEAFVRLHPDLGVDVTRPTSAAEARHRLEALLDLKRPPDLVLPIGGDGISRFVDRKLWLDLAPLMAKDDIDLDDFAADASRPARATGYYGNDGKRVVALPVGLHASALACNADLFARARVPLPPASWSDPAWTLHGAFLDAATRLTDAKGGRYGTGHLSPGLSFFGFGGRYYHPDTRRAQFDRPASIAGARFAGELVHARKVQVARAGEEAAWREGRVAMIELCSCELGGPLGTVPFALHLAAVPGGPGRRHAAVDVQMGAIVESSTQHESAWELLKFLAVEPANEKRMAAEGMGAIPALAANAGAFDAGRTAFWADALRAGSTDAGAWFPAFGAVTDLAAKAFASILDDGAPAADAMARLQRDAQARVDAWFDRNDLP